MSTTVNTGWLMNENKNKFAPKTLVSQVIDNNGRKLENILEEHNYYAICESEQNTVEKYVNCHNFNLFYGVEITIKFINSARVSPPLRLNINNIWILPITYQGKSSYIDIKANGTYKFKYNGSEWELIGDLNKENLIDFGIHVSAKEINCLEGATENIPEQIKNTRNNLSTNGEPLLTGSQTNTISRDGLVVMSGHITSADAHGAVWLKVNGIEVYKVQKESTGGVTTSYKFPFKVYKGDIVQGNASVNPVLTFFPNM